MPVSILHVSKAAQFYSGLSEVGLLRDELKSTFEVWRIHVYCSLLLIEERNNKIIAFIFIIEFLSSFLLVQFNSFSKYSVKCSLKGVINTNAS